MSLAEAASLSAPSGTDACTPALSRPRLRLRRVRPSDDVVASVGDGASASAMIGLGETYFAAFALALGTGQTLAGLVATVPMLAGATLQLATPFFLQRVRSYKKWVVLFACMQAAALLSMPLAVALSDGAAASWVFLTASIYWAASQATGPAWNTWIEEIVPKRIRAKFFARRARICQIATLIAFVLGGLALHAGSTSGRLLTAFVAVFVTGAASRFLSAWFLSRHSEPLRGRYQMRPVPIVSVFKSGNSDGGVALVAYLLAMQVAVQVSGPYVVPFILAEQRLSYLSYMLLIGLAYFGKVIALPLWGRVAHQGGARRLLWIGGTSIIPMAALWLGVDLFPGSKLAYMAVAQIVSGFVWAAYELAMQLMFFEAIPRRDRPCMLTYYNFGNAAAQVAGCFIGAAILQLGGEGHTAYLTLFVVSSLLRLCTVPLLRQIQDQPPQLIEPIMPVEPRAAAPLHRAA